MRTRSQWFLIFMLISMLGGMLVACSSGDDNGDPTAQPSTAPVTTATSATRGTALVKVDATLPPEQDVAARDCDTAIDTNKSVDAAALKQAMTCVIPLFPWPDGKQPGAALVKTRVESFMGWQTAGFQGGMAYTIIAGFNTCAWSQEWLESWQADDADRQAVALDYLLTVVPDPAASIPGFPADGYDISTTRAYLHAAQQAQLGDPAPVQDVVNQCGDIDWPTS